LSSGSGNRDQGELQAMREQRAVVVDYLPQLNEAVAHLIVRPIFHSVVDSLKKQLLHTAEPFVWSTIDLQSITAQLPDSIRSCWIFVLKKDMPSGCHYHPNSIQHMVIIEGEGTSKIGPNSRQMKRFDDSDCSLDEIWYVIPEGVPHEFFPTGRDMVVISFHTCASDELEEISCESGAMRNYEPRA
jgi:mannose-6-phosphate isomerase-like protein (cupin superfamily)